MQFEYKSIDYYGHTDIGELNQLGAQGWEVIGYSVIANNNGNLFHYVLLKRRIK